MRALALVLCLLVALVAEKSWGSEAETGGKIPSSVAEYDPEQGFRLTEPAIKRLGIRFEMLKGTGPWILPKTALVNVKRSIGVYRRSNGFVTLVLVEPSKSDQSTTSIKSEDLTAGDEVSVGGAAFLRVVDLDLSGGGGDSCAE